MKQLWKRFLVEEEGATATEYAVMLALIVAAAIIAIDAIGKEVNTTFETVEGKIEAANTSAGSGS